MKTLLIVAMAASMTLGATDRAADDRAAAVLAQVLANAERSSGAGEDQGADRWVTRDSVHRIIQCHLRLEGHGVHRLGSVERDRGDGSGDVEQYGTGL